VRPGVLKPAMADAQRPQQGRGRGRGGGGGGGGGGRDGGGCEVRWGGRADGLERDGAWQRGGGAGRARGRGGRGGARGGGARREGHAGDDAQVPSGGSGGPPDSAGSGFQYLRVSDGIVGTCAEVERRYVRVQSQPDPGSVRPAPVLQKALLAVARREAAGEPYEDTNDFYMSICQDLRLQQIESELTVAAREGFALCAMRARVGPPGGDKTLDVKALSDCLLHLRALYARNPGQPRQLEFAVYRFLMWLGLAAGGAADTAAQLGMALRDVAAHAPDAVVSHATRIMSAVATGDARQYFALVAAPPAATAEQGHIHETLLAPAVRMRAYQSVLKAYKFAVPLVSLEGLLGLRGAALAGWLSQQHAVLDAEALDVDACKKAFLQA